MDADLQGDVSNNDDVWGFAYSHRNLGVTALYSIAEFDYKYLIFPNNIERYLQKISLSPPALII